MKRCTRTVWKTMLVQFSKFSCLLQGITDRYFDEMCGNSQPQMFVYRVFNYRKNEINAWKTWHLAWCAMVWPHHTLVQIWEGLAYVVMHALHKSNNHQGTSMLSRGKSPRLKGDPNFLCPRVFSMMSIQLANHRVQIWNFSGFICHI